MALAAMALAEVRVYVPIVACIVISVVATIVLNLFFRR
jgi:hypothetical protein